MEEDFRLLAKYFMQLVEGDDWILDDAMKLLERHGFINEYGEFIDLEEDES